MLPAKRTSEMEEWLSYSKRACELANLLWSPAESDIEASCPNGDVDDQVDSTPGESSFRSVSFFGDVMPLLGEEMPSQVGSSASDCAESHKAAESLEGTMPTLSCVDEEPLANDARSVPERDSGVAGRGASGVDEARGDSEFAAAQKDQDAADEGALGAVGARSDSEFGAAQKDQYVADRGASGVDEARGDPECEATQINSDAAGRDALGAGGARSDSEFVANQITQMLLIDAHLEAMRAQLGLISCKRG